MNINLKINIMAPKSSDNKGSKSSKSSSSKSSNSSGTSKRGFASMDEDKQREIARKGGKASHGGRGK